MNQLGALSTGTNADLAASGISSLTTASLGADFALLLGQISKDSSQGLGGALQSNAVRNGRTSYVPSSGQGAQRRRNSSNQALESLGSSSDASSSAASQESPRAGSPRADSAKAGGNADSSRARAADKRDGHAGDPQVQERVSEPERPQAANDAARADEPEEAPDGALQDQAVDETALEADAALVAADALDPNALPPSGNAEDPSWTLLEGAPEAHGPGASDDGDPVMDAAAKAVADAGRAVQKAVTDAAQEGADTAANRDDGAAMQELAVDAAEAQALKQDPSEAKPVSENSAALGELFEDAGVTRGTVSETPGAAQSQAAQETADELSAIADSVQAAAELFPEQDDGASAGAGADQDASSGSSSSDGLDGALAVLRHGSLGDGGNADGSPEENASARGGVNGALEMLAGKASQSGVSEAQDSGSAVKAGAASAASATGIAAAASAEAAGVSPLSQSRAAAREALDAQDLRDAMLSLSSDVKRNAEEITKAVMAMSSRNLKTINFELNPEGLGSMQIQIDSDKDGDAVRIGISASSSQARGILAQGMDALREGLLKNGIFAQAELEGGDQGSLAQDGSNGSGFFQGQEQQGSGNEGGQWQGRGTLFATGPSDGSGDVELAQDGPVPGSAGEDGLSLFA